MIPILVVSMNTDLERRKFIENKFSKYGIKFNYIDAVVGKLIDQATLDNIDVSKAMFRKKRHVSLGEIGCTLSHVKAFKYIIENSIPYCLILEDDAIFDERLAGFINLFCPRDLSNFKDDLFILGGQNGIDKSKFISKSFFSKIKIGSATFSKTIKSEKYIFRTCCYLISLDIAKKLFTLSQKEFFIADEWSYLKTAGAFRNIYISDIVDHPLDLSTSHIEQERRLSISSYEQPSKKNALKSLFEDSSLAKLAKTFILNVRTLGRRFHF